MGGRRLGTIRRGIGPACGGTFRRAARRPVPPRRRAAALPSILFREGTEGCVRIPIRRLPRTWTRWTLGRARRRTSGGRWLCLLLFDLGGSSVTTSRCSWRKMGSGEELTQLRMGLAEEFTQAVAVWRGEDMADQAFDAARAQELLSELGPALATRGVGSCRRSGRHMCAARVPRSLRVRELRGFGSAIGRGLLAGVAPFIS